MDEITLMLTFLLGERHHKTPFAITDDRRVVSDCVLFIKVTSYVISVSVNRDIKYRSRLSVIILCKCNLDFVLAAVVILTMALRPIRDDGVSFRGRNVVRNER